MGLQIRLRWVVLRYVDLRDEFEAEECMTASVVARFQTEKDAEAYALRHFGREAMFETGEIRICED